MEEDLLLHGMDRCFEQMERDERNMARIRHSRKSAEVEREIMKASEAISLPNLTSDRVKKQIRYTENALQKLNPMLCQCIDELLNAIPTEKSDYQERKSYLKTLYRIPELIELYIRVNTRLVLAVQEVYMNTGEPICISIGQNKSGKYGSEEDMENAESNLTQIFEDVQNMKHHPSLSEVKKRAIELASKISKERK